MIWSPTAIPSRPSDAQGWISSHTSGAPSLPCLVAPEPTERLGGTTDADLTELAFLPVRTLHRDAELSGVAAELFRDFAYNGVFARGSTLKERPQAARAVVAAIVEAEQRIQDPNQLDEIVKVAQAYMRGIDADLLRAYLQSYRGNFSPVATPAAIRNISQMLLAGKLIAQPVSWSQVVAQDLMPRELPQLSDH